MGEYAMSPASDLLDMSEITHQDLQRARDALSLAPTDMVQKASVGTVRRQAILMKMADKVEQACDELGHVVDDDTVVAIATTLCVDGGELFEHGNPLAKEDHRLAVEIVYRWARSKSPTRSEFDLRTLAEQAVAFGEAGRGNVSFKPQPRLIEKEPDPVGSANVASTQRKPNPCGMIGFGLGIASILLSFTVIIPLLGIVLSVIGLATFDEAKHDKKWQVWWGLGLSIVYTLVGISVYF